MLWRVDDDDDDEMRIKMLESSKCSNSRDNGHRGEEEDLLLPSSAI